MTRSPTFSTTPVAGPVSTTSPTPAWSSRIMNTPDSRSLTIDCAPTASPAATSDAPPTMPTAAFGSTCGMMITRAMITTMTVARFCSTLPSVRVRCTTRAVWIGDAMSACVSAAPWRFLTS